MFNSFIKKIKFTMAKKQEVSSKEHLASSVDPYSIFCKNGYKPWTEGYEDYKWQQINEMIDSDHFFNKMGTEKFGFRIDERIVEYPWFFSSLPDGPGTLLDAGSALNFSSIVQHRKLQQKKIFISTLAPEHQAFWKQGVSYIYEDIRESCFKDEFFDYISCISTIEHVGMDNTLLYTNEESKSENDTSSYFEFLDVLRSKLKPGGILYLTMPFGQYKNHKWFHVFDSSMLDKLLMRFSPLRYTENIFFYNNDRWNLSSREEAKNATCFDIHVQKNYTSDFLAFSRSVACLELVKGKTEDCF